MEIKVPKDILRGFASKQEKGTRFTNSMPVKEGKLRKRDPEDIMLSEISQSLKDKYLISLI